MKYRNNRIQSTKFKTWSNIFFLFPFILSLQFQIFTYSLIIGVMIILSLLFHYSDEKKYFYRDCFISILLMVSNFVLLISGEWQAPYSIIALSSAVLAIYFYIRQYKKGYNFNHGMWHVLSAIVCYYSILTFLK